MLLSLKLLFIFGIYRYGLNKCVEFTNRRRDSYYAVQTCERLLSFNFSSYWKESNSRLGKQEASFHLFTVHKLALSIPSSLSLSLNAMHALLECRMQNELFFAAKAIKWIAVVLFFGYV